MLLSRVTILKGNLTLEDQDEDQHKLVSLPPIGGHWLAAHNITHD